MKSQQIRAFARIFLPPSMSDVGALHSIHRIGWIVSNEAEAVVQAVNYSLKSYIMKFRRRGGKRFSRRRGRKPMTKRAYMSIARGGQRM